MIAPMLVLMMQAAPSSDGADARHVGVVLPPVRHIAACPPARSDDDIVVCGRSDAAEAFRVRPLPDRYREVGGPGLGVDLGKGARGNLYTSSGVTTDGKVGKRVMVKVTMPF